MFLDRLDPWFVTRQWASFIIKKCMDRRPMSYHSRPPYRLVNRWRKLTKCWITCLYYGTCLYFVIFFSILLCQQYEILFQSCHVNLQVDPRSNKVLRFKHCNSSGLHVNDECNKATSDLFVVKTEAHCWDMALHLLRLCCWLKVFGTGMSQDGLISSSPLRLMIWCFYFLNVLTDPDDAVFVFKKFQHDTVILSLENTEALPSSRLWQINIMQKSLACPRISPSVDVFFHVNPPQKVSPTL